MSARPTAPVQLEPYPEVVAFELSALKRVVVQIVASLSAFLPSDLLCAFLIHFARGCRLRRWRDWGGPCRRLWRGLRRWFLHDSVSILGRWRFVHGGVLRRGLLALRVAIPRRGRGSLWVARASLLQQRCRRNGEGEGRSASSFHWRAGHPSAPAIGCNDSEALSRSGGASLS